MPAVGFHPGPAVVTSTKPDVLNITQPWRAHHGRCWLWDPTATTACPAGVEPLRWSPLIGCQHWDQAVGRAHALANAARPDRHGNETHWVERAQALLAPLLHAAALDNADMAQVLTWLHRHELDQPHTILTQHDSTLAADTLQGIAAN